MIHMVYERVCFIIVVHCITLIMAPCFIFERKLYV